MDYDDGFHDEQGEGEDRVERHIGGEALTELNRICCEVADRHSVMVSELVSMNWIKGQHLQAPRLDLILTLRNDLMVLREVREVGKSKRRVRSIVEVITREQFEEEAAGLELQGWDVLSLPDIAFIMGSKNHTAILYQLRKTMKASKEASPDGQVDSSDEAEPVSDMRED